MILAPCLALVLAWGELPCFVWRVDGPGEALPAELAEAFGGVNVEGTDEARAAREAGLDFYVGHAPGRDALHYDRDDPRYEALWQAYWHERDASALVRQPCLSEPATLRSLEARLARSLRARGGDAGLGASLGDEVGLTRYGGPLDLCASASCRAAYEAFVDSSARWRERVPRREGRPAFPSTDEVRRAWTEGDASLVAAWLARREFHHEVTCEVLEHLAAHARALAPEVPLGLLGLGGRTAFGGVAVERVLPWLDFLEAYPALDTRELLLTQRRPDQRAWATIYREEGAPSAPGWRIREHVLRGGDALVLWSDRELATDERYLSEARRAVADARAWRAALPLWRPAPAGLAVVHDPESAALSWLRDALLDGPTWPKRFSSYHNEHGTREVLLRAALRLAEDAGLFPGSVPLEQVGPELAGRFGVLLLVENLVLEDAELARLEAFVAAGGEVWSLGRCGVWDLSGERSERDPQETAWIRPLELDGERYLAGRAAYPRPYAAQRVTELRARLAAAGVRSPCWRPIAGEDAAPWLLFETPGAVPGEVWCAALPNHPREADRLRLVDLKVRVKDPLGRELEWVSTHAQLPDGEVLLRAGEALVFKLRPRE